LHGVLDSPVSNGMFDEVIFLNSLGFYANTEPFYYSPRVVLKVDVKCILFRIIFFFFCDRMDMIPVKFGFIYIENVNIVVSVEQLDEIVFFNKLFGTHFVSLLFN
jgi:hypothetical protein